MPVRRRKQSDEVGGAVELAAADVDRRSDVALRKGTDAGIEAVHESAEREEVERAGRRDFERGRHDLSIIINACSPPGRSSTAATKCSSRSPRGAWARSTGRAARCSATRSPSRSSAPTTPPTRRRASASCARAAPAAQLRHPNIVSILDFNLDAEGRPFLVMELLSGPSLRQAIAARESPFSIAETLGDRRCRSAARCSSRTTTA